MGGAIECLQALWAGPKRPLPARSHGKHVTELPHIDRCAEELSQKLFRCEAPGPTKHLTTQGRALAHTCGTEGDEGRAVARRHHDVLQTHVTMAELGNVDARRGVDVLQSPRYVSEDSRETAHIQLTLRQDDLQRVSRDNGVGDERWIRCQVEIPDPGDVRALDSPDGIQFAPKPGFRDVGGLQGKLVSAAVGCEEYRALARRAQLPAQSIARNVVAGGQPCVVGRSLTSSPASLADGARRDGGAAGLGVVVRRATFGATRPLLSAAAGDSAAAGLGGSHVTSLERFEVPCTVNFCRNAVLRVGIGNIDGGLDTSRWSGSCRQPPVFPTHAMRRGADKRLARIVAGPSTSWRRVSLRA